MQHDALGGAGMKVRGEVRIAFDVHQLAEERAGAS